MSIEAIAWAFKKVHLDDPSAKFVLIALCNYTDDENRAWPSVNTLCQITGFSRRSIQNHLRRLEELGLIIGQERHRADGSNSTTLYIVQMGDGAEFAPPTSGQKMRPQSVKPARGGAKFAQLEPSLNLQSESMNLPACVREAPEPSDDGWPKDHLEQFWQAFPPFRREAKRKVGEKLAKLRAAKTIAWEALIAAVRKFAGTNPGDFAPAPIVWLNNERWDREYGNQNGTPANGKDRNNREPKLGFSGLAAQLRRNIADRAACEAPIFDASDLQPDDGRRYAAAPVGGLDRTGQASPFTPPSERR